MKRMGYLVALLVLALMYGCVEPYNPPEVKDTPDILVVDGFLNASDNSASVRLSKAIALSSDEDSPPVDGDNSIVVRIEDEQGNSFSLQRMTAGVYESADLPISMEKRYRVYVFIPPNGEYVSDYVEVTQTPTMDVSYDPAPDNLRILVNTGDPAGASKYYRWTFSETWEYTSAYYSGFKVVDGVVYARPADEQIYRCYKTVNSSNIYLASSTELSSDVIANYLLQSVPRSSQKLQHRYSINVKQYTLSEDAYNYWLALYRTTENVGGLFDPLPGEVIGNLKSIRDPEKTVIGYFSAGTVQQQRIFVTAAELPEAYASFRAPRCLMDTVKLENIPVAGDRQLLISEIYSTSGFPQLIGYLTSEPNCIDCRLIFNGETNKPPFWP